MENVSLETGSYDDKASKKKEVLIQLHVRRRLKRAWILMKMLKLRLGGVT
jgi:hypothetical protein